MRAAAMSVWIFINLVCFGMCGYLYLIWSQYWMYLEKQKLLNKSENDIQKDKPISLYQDTYTSDKYIHSYVTLSNNSTAADSLGKNRRSAVGTQWTRKSTGTQIRPSTNIVKKSQGSPRFPNTHKTVLELDSDKYVCEALTDADCESKSREFKELLLKEFHRVLMTDGDVFKSGLDSQNPYNVKYEANGIRQTRSGKEILCSLLRIPVGTVTSTDEPFASEGFQIPKLMLMDNQKFNTCAIVTSAGALLGSRLGAFIDSHDMVLRFNNAPTENYTVDVGSKTTFRILNSQVVTKPEYEFLENPLYKSVSILIWDPANFSSSLEEWYKYPDFPLFPVYKKFLQQNPNAGVHLLYPEILWSLWSVLQDASPYRLRKNPPSSGFIGLWFALHRCSRVRMFEYVPSSRATRRCHYHSSGENSACTFGAWHPLAQEKSLAERLRDNSDVHVFQLGYIDIPGFKTIVC